MSDKVNPGGRRRLLLGEGLVIFLGAALALFADDWRESRAERVEVTRTLAVIDSDLANDSAEMVNAVTSMMAAETGAHWLLSRWAATDVPADSILASSSGFLTTAYPEFRTGGFDGLQNANLLRLVDDPELRTWLLLYYDEVQPSFERYFYDVVLPRRERVLLEYEEYQVWYPLVAEGWDAGRMRSSWSEITSDAELESALTFFYGANGSMRERMTAVLGLVGQGRRLLSEELGTIPDSQQ